MGLFMLFLGHALFLTDLLNSLFLLFTKSKFENLFLIAIRIKNLIASNSPKIPLVKI